MAGRPRARRAIIEQPGVLLCVGDEFRHGIGANFRMNRKYTGRFSEACDRLEIGQRIEIHPAHARDDREYAQRRNEHGVTVRRGPRDIRRGKCARCTALIVHHNGGAGLRRQPLRDDPRNRIAVSGRRKRHDEPDRMVGELARHRWRGNRTRTGEKKASCDFNFPSHHHPSAIDRIHIACWRRSRNEISRRPASSHNASLTQDRLCHSVSRPMFASSGLARNACGSR